jgi:hypothetical protein
MDVQGMQVLRASTSNIQNPPEKNKKQEANLYITPKKVKESDRDLISDMKVDTLQMDLHRNKDSPLSDISNLPIQSHTPIFSSSPINSQDFHHKPDNGSNHRSELSFFTFNRKELLDHHDSSQRVSIQDLDKYSLESSSRIKSLKPRWSVPSCDDLSNQETVDFPSLPSSISPRRHPRSSFKVPEIFSKPSRISEKFESLLKSFKQI